MSGVEVHDAGDLRKYRTEIPNVVAEMGLSPHAVALYFQLKRTAGQNGACWKATKRLAEECKMSAGKVSGARAELEKADLIVVERPKDRTKPVVVTITDIWLRNFEHFGTPGRRVQNMKASRSEYETRKEPVEEGVEANASSGKPQTVALEKHIVDGIYAAMKEAGFRLPNEHFAYQLGRAKDVLDKDKPSDEEVEGLPEAFVGLWTIKGQADVHTALMEMRRQKARAEMIEQNRLKAGEARSAPWEPINPHGAHKESVLSPAERERVEAENARNAAELADLLSENAG